MSAACLRLPFTLRRAVPVAVLTALCLANPALALDYERNDVSVRGVGLGFALAPVTPPCRTCSAPVATFVRGEAARQRRFLYVGVEAALGVIFDGRPWLSIGGMVGGETADNAFVKLRGYAELGTQLTFMNSNSFDYLQFSIEGGLRYQVRDWVRPHMLLFLGARGLTNFTHFGGLVHAGLLWTFD